MHQLSREYNLEEEEGSSPKLKLEADDTRHETQDGSIKRIGILHQGMVPTTTDDRRLQEKWTTTAMEPLVLSIAAAVM